MTGIRSFGTGLPILLAAILGLSSPTSAQQTQPAPKAAAQPAPKAGAQPASKAAAQPAPKAAAQPATAPAGDSQPTLLGQYADWGAYTASPGGKKVCFALGKPKASQTTPPGRKRDPAFIFISNRPAEKVKNEISVIIGYPFKASTDASAEIGTAKFAMYTQNDGAWIKNVADEARMLDAMRKGSDLTIKGTSGRGTQSSDQFSLKGLSEALARVEQECK